MIYGTETFPVRRRVNPPSEFGWLSQKWFVVVVWGKKRTGSMGFLWSVGADYVN